MRNLYPNPIRHLKTILISVAILVTLLLTSFTVDTSTDLSQTIGAEHNRGASQQLTNVIKNGGFEESPRSDVATYWKPFNNGQALYGWYAENWEEAIHSGRRSQLLEIDEVFGLAKNRVIGIYQTVDVEPNAQYNLTFYALMRSNAPIEDRNMGEYKAEWGIDFGGTGKDYNVDTWHDMKLNEQLRLGSNGQHSHDSDYLSFELIQETIHTGNSTQLTFFIRGVKIEPTGTEVNFNIDDVSLVGPYYPPTATPDPNATPTATPAPASAIEAAAGSTSENNQESNLPNAGGVPANNLSVGTLGLGTLMLIALGAAAFRNLLRQRKQP